MFDAQERRRSSWNFDLLSIVKCARARVRESFALEFGSFFVRLREKTRIQRAYFCFYFYCKSQTHTPRYWIVEKRIPFHVSHSMQGNVNIFGQFSPLSLDRFYFNRHYSVGAHYGLFASDRQSLSIDNYTHCFYPRHTKWDKVLLTRSLALSFPSRATKHVSQHSFREKNVYTFVWFLDIPCLFRRIQRESDSGRNVDWKWRHFIDNGFCMFSMISADSVILANRLLQYHLKGRKRRWTAFRAISLIPRRMRSLPIMVLLKFFQFSYSRIGLESCKTLAQMNDWHLILRS